MNKFNLGSLEEMVLLVLLTVSEEAYGITILDAYIDNTGNRISLSAIHSVLRRLEKKGFITSEMGGSTSDRGGRRKRLYQITKYGYKTVEAIQENLNRIWQQMPKLEF